MPYLAADQEKVGFFVKNLKDLGQAGPLNEVTDSTV
jgi:hypothetical protein